MAYYKIPEDQAAKLPTEPENVLPFLAARLHSTVVQNVQQMIEQALPQQIGAYIKVQEAETAAKKAFYDAWPALQPYEQQVLQAGQLYRQLNPNVSSQDFIKAVGELVSRSLNIAIAAAPAAPGAAPAPVAAPAAPAASPGFVPAGGRGSSGPAPAEENVFTQLAMEED